MRHVVNNSWKFHEILFSGLSEVADYRLEGTDERTNERTDIRITIYPRNFVCGGYNNIRLGYS